VSVANPERGEVALLLRTGPYVVRPTFSALVAAEGEVGSLFQLLERAGAGDVRLTDMAALFWHGLAGDQRRGDRLQFEKELLDAGVATLVPAYRQLLSGIFGSR
jgi:hypothetical protein